MPHSSISGPVVDRAEGGADEVASIAPLRLAKPLGVVRRLIETYSVGTFRYTKLEDAIAQARRMTKLEQEPI